jgi:hypothetical protein
MPQTSRTTSYVLATVLGVLTVLSLLFLLRMTRTPEANLTPQKDRRSAIPRRNRAQQRAKDKQAEELMSGLEYLERMRVPFAPSEPLPPPPEPAPEPPTPATPPPQTIPAGKPKKRPFIRPRLKPTNAKTRGSSSARSSAFLPSPKDQDNKAPSSTRTTGAATSNNAPTRQWRTPTGQSSNRP